MSKIIMKYRVTCWVTGDLAQLKMRTQTEELLRILARNYPGRAEEIIKDMRNDHPGKILQDFRIESPEGQRNVKEMLAACKILNPTAELASWDEIKE